MADQYWVLDLYIEGGITKGVRHSDIRSAAVCGVADINLMCQVGAT